MKKFIAVPLILFALLVRSQDYNLIPVNPNAQGNPGDLFRASVHVQNTNGESDIVMHLKRIVKNLPPYWTSCFCFPDCIAPWIDTMTFLLPAGVTDSIEPNFGTDSVPGIGYITITLYQEGFPNHIDTITFSGSTLPAGIISIAESGINIFPNPVSQILNISCKNFSSAELFSADGRKVLRIQNSTVDVSALPDGIYFLQIISGSKTFTSKIIKQ